MKLLKDLQTGDVVVICNRIDNELSWKLCRIEGIQQRDNIYDNGDTDKVIDIRVSYGPLPNQEYERYSYPVSEQEKPHAELFYEYKTSKIYADFLDAKNDIEKSDEFLKACQLIDVYNYL